MQNPIHLDKALLFSRNQVFCLKNEKFDELQLIQSWILFVEYYLFTIYTLPIY